MKRVVIVCDVCGEPIVGFACQPHILDAEWDVSENNVHYHPECCPDCRAEDDAADDVKWREFVANELMSEEAERLGL